MQTPHDSGEIDQFKAPTLAVHGLRNACVLTLSQLEQWISLRPKCSHLTLTCGVCRDTERVSQAVSSFGCANLVPMR